MPRISDAKKEKIQEQILYFLYSIFPRQVFTVDIAKEMARDEEFIKILMIELYQKELVIKIDKNSQGIKYEKRLRWRISNKAYGVYNLQQHKSTQEEIQNGLSKQTSKETST